MELSELKEKLSRYQKSDITITNHAELQAFTRNVDVEEVKKNVINPTRLVYAKKQEAKYKGRKNMTATLLIQNTSITDML